MNRKRKDLIKHLEKALGEGVVQEKPLSVTKDKGEYLSSDDKEEHGDEVQEAKKLLFPSLRVAKQRRRKLNLHLSHKL